MDKIKDINAGEATLDPALDSLYEKIRSQVEHEDDLVNHRIQWLLMVETVLFSGCGYLYAEDRLSIEACYCISTLGLLLCLLSSCSCRGAFKSLKVLRDTWANHPLHSLSSSYGASVEDWERRCGIQSGFPQISFEGSSFSSAKTCALGMHCLIISAWLVLYLMIVLTS
ncbi:MAG: hypothetical protein JW739_01020 [Opitutales bacterium]|nr:hypothetical protein [Opitutales bacterium]